MNTIRDRFIAAVVPREGETGRNFQRAAHQIAESQQPDGSWNDIDYADKARSVWKSNKHLNNLLQMAKANAAAPDAKLKDATIKGLAWWLKNDPHNPNWWHNEIGVPQLLGETAMVMGDDLPGDQRAGVIDIMKRSVWTKWTGQNLVWGVGNQIVRGILEHNEQTVADAYARMYEEIRVEKPQAEGIMPDASFHQHGSQFYSGGYGLAFANDVGRFVAYAWGTQFQIPPEKMQIYTRFMLDGEQWMVRGSTFDYSATGREITRKGKTAVPRDWMNGPVTPVGAGYGLGTVVSALSQLDFPRRDQFDQFAKRLHGDADAAALSGNRYYWCSDYMAHQRPGFLVSVRMFSSRLFNSELVNDEGKKSHHLADGCTLIYRSGDEYRDIFPVWDWNKVPGTTAERGELEKGGNHIKAKSDFVGGVSDGTYGVCVQDLQRGKLTAHKFWMMLDNGFVALGAGINCDSDNPMVTSINQCILHGDVSKTDHSVSHDGFTYVIPAPQHWNLTTGAQTGKWSDIGTGSSEPVTMNVFNLSIDHGPHPTNASYNYFVFAGEDHSSDIKIVSNTPALQAVAKGKLKLLGIAFWKEGKLETDASAVEVDQPCLVLVRDKQVSVSNPRNQPLTVHLIIDGEAMTFDLPGGADAGSTATRATR
jgi:chondroitin AC lyase